MSWGVLTLLTGFAPTLMAASATGAMVSLFVVRLLLGATNAPMFPSPPALSRAGFPTGRLGFAERVRASGSRSGRRRSARSSPLLIVHYGWRESFYVLAPLGLLIGAWWYWYGRDRPAQHRAITAEEVRLIEGDRAPRTRRAGARRVAPLLVQRDVLLLAASYFCMNYVFYMFAQWLFTYLVEERGFSLLESGWLYALPFVTGAVLAVVGGLTCDCAVHTRRRHAGAAACPR